MIILQDESNKNNKTQVQNWGGGDLTSDNRRIGDNLISPNSLCVCTAQTSHIKDKRTSALPPGTEKMAECGFFTFVSSSSAHTMLVKGPDHPSFTNVLFTLLFKLQEQHLTPDHCISRVKHCSLLKQWELWSVVFFFLPFYQYSFDPRLLASLKNC